MIVAEAGALPRFSEVFDHLMSGAYDGRERTLSEVARATGISRPYLQQVRRGEVANPGTDMVYRLATYFDIDPGVIVRAIIEVDTPLPARTSAPSKKDDSADASHHTDTGRTPTT